MSGVTREDRRRMNDGNRAAALAEPKTQEEIRQQIDQIDAALTALQSIDDCGSREALEAVEEQSRGLESKLANLRARVTK